MKEEDKKLIELTESNKRLRTINKDLLAACNTGNFSDVKRLLDKGANVLFQDGATHHMYGDDENGPLHIAARANHIDIVKLLVEKKAKIDSKNRKKQTPLHLAIYGGELSIVELLVSNGANLEGVDIDGGTPLSWAAYLGNLEILKYLVEIGARLDTKDYNNSFPLHWACYNGKITVIEYLLNSGACGLKEKNSNDDTPLDCAIINGYLDIANIIIAFKD